jgi:hypothetical protein
MRALPREAAIEHQHLTGSAPPFPNQPGPGLQLRARAYPPLSALFELPSKLAELAVPLRAEAADSEFLHPVRNSAQQQLAAEVRRWIGFVEGAPMLPELAKAELGEARQRLPASRRILDCGSCLLRRNAVDPAALLLRRG